MNKGKEDNLLPKVATLYDKYIDWGILYQVKKKMVVLFRY
jgi:hypothetical protein